jgi:thymidylate synthase
MYISHDKLDDLMHEVLETLLKEEQIFQASKGAFKELFGWCLHLKNPRARLSRSEGRGKLFSALGEFFWYLSRDTQLFFIDYYVPNRFQVESDDQVRVRSGYGDRLFNMRGINQVSSVIELLKEKSSSRRAVIQLFDASDLEQHYASAPCTCTLQFLVRNGALHLFTSMRSNDAYLGLPHDVFSFTMIQELVARSIGVEVGEYKHCVGSLHLYKRNFPAAEHYLGEGWHSTVPMEPMPEGDPWASIGVLQHLEEELRMGRDIDLDKVDLEPYWKDIARLLMAYRAIKNENIQELEAVKSAMSSPTYKTFIEARLDKLVQARAAAVGQAG